MSTNEIKQSINKRDIRLICIAALLMVIATTIQYLFMRDSMFSEAKLRAQSELTIASQKIETAVTNVESTVNTMAYSISQREKRNDDLYDIATKIIKNNPDIGHCTIAFAERMFWPEVTDVGYAVHCYREGDQIRRERLTDDYLEESWYRKAESKLKAFWDEPFLEKEKLATRYVCPMVNKNGIFIGVMTVNVPTDALTKEIKGLPEYPHSYAKLISEKGHKIIGPNEYVKEDQALHFTNPIGKVGWNLTVVCPDSDINRNIETSKIIVLAMQLLSILLLFFIVIKSLINLRKLNKTVAEKTRMGDELTTASQVQKSMILTKPESLPSRKNLDIQVKMLNASEMTGDFYDSFINDNLLYFCIGDVAGKGAPAALTMAMTISAFRTSARHSEDPGSLMNDINHSLCRKNEETTTVKLFCGILNLSDGELRYCNAGMHEPILLTENDFTEIEVADNPRAGINANFEFKEQKTQIAEDSTIFLYTDGLTEAENKKGTEWGIKHLTAQLSSTTRMNSEELLDRITESVTKHAKGTALSDDLTMMAIKFQTK